MLVGAGPGNSGLMTLQGLRALQEADVIVHDRLVSAEVLDLARRDAARFDVGKFVGGGGATQEEINKLLVEHAQRGEYVVRLKGGDPFVFGRGGEEIDFLRANGVSYEVIPGITAALAAGAYAGVPLTDRRYSQAVRFLTGNSDEQLAQFNYSDLAAGRETLAFYMSVGRLAALRDKLLASGVQGDMPVAFIENASRAEQRVIVSTVEGMQRDAVMQKIKAPAMLIIGNVAKTAAELQWFGRSAISAEAAPPDCSGMSDNPYAPPKARVGEPVARGLTEAPPEARLVLVDSDLSGDIYRFATGRRVADRRQSKDARTPREGEPGDHHGHRRDIGVNRARHGVARAVSKSCPLRRRRRWLSGLGRDPILDRSRKAPCGRGSLFSWWRVVGLALLAAAIVFTIAVTVVALYSVVVTRE